MSTQKKQETLKWKKEIDYLQEPQTYTINAKSRGDLEFQITDLHNEFKWGCANITGYKKRNQDSTGAELDMRGANGVSATFVCPSIKQAKTLAKAIANNSTKLVTY